MRVLYRAIVYFHIILLVYYGNIDCSTRHFVGIPPDFRHSKFLYVTWVILERIAHVLPLMLAKLFFQGSGCTLLEMQKVFELKAGA